MNYVYMYNMNYVYMYNMNYVYMYKILNRHYDVVFGTGKY